MFLLRELLAEIRIATAILGLRHDPRLLKLPPYLSALCILVGTVWLLLLPLNEYSRQTYVSENALLPGQVHTYFGGSEHNIFRAYRHEVHALEHKSAEERTEKFVELLKDCGLKVGRQKYEYSSAGNTVSGENVYAVLQGPRADATEAIVLIGAWRNMDNVINYSGVALVLTLARYFKRWSLWSKDIIFLLPFDSASGSQAWVDAYHDAHDPLHVQPLSIKSGALQGAIAVDYPAGPWGHRFEKLHIVYDGVNGQLPNLDLFNTAVNIASGQMGIGTTLQRMWHHSDSYRDRLMTMLRGMLSQGLGHVSGPHSAFIPYHVDAITVQTVGDGWHDEMSLGRTVESLCRSLNNLLEHLHQSFFFYLLMQANRFVSIGTYLPSAMIIAANFTITSIVLWVQSGRPAAPSKVASTSNSEKEKAKEPDLTIVKEGRNVALVPAAAFEVIERHLFLPVGFIATVHFLGLLPLYVFNTAPQATLKASFTIFTILTLVLPHAFSQALARIPPQPPTPQQITLIQSFSLLLLGLFLSALATLNFSLSLMIGLLSTPFSFVRPSKSPILVGLMNLLLAAMAPPVVMGGIAWWFGKDVGELLAQASFGWHVWGMWTQVVIWLVWWPAWVTASVVAIGALY
ncbi:Glycosylphosphatidylinositol:protein transamidase, GAA1 component [Rhizodiscina lignyota]|uniref:Glycosylphosphatidylinositol:protein transamidase, GAA1 component n=1 Tax=Rhizodiscina lignyota TaxID=1504668 RepID=A0A9P4IEU7_9PEZI|nr:Glycosylphosphatidylinositol:protein transamidase, GAA1 component [Rhizodiscina lignyota]